MIHFNEGEMIAKVEDVLYTQGACGHPDQHWHMALRGDAIASAIILGGFKFFPRRDKITYDAFGMEVDPEKEFDQDTEIVLWLDHLAQIGALPIAGWARFVGGASTKNSWSEWEYFIPVAQDHPRHPDRRLGPKRKER